MDTSETTDLANVPQNLDASESETPELVQNQRKRKARTPHAEFSDYFGQSEKDGKKFYVCKLKKPDGANCLKEYIATATSNAMLVK